MGDSSSERDVFDLEKIRDLIALMQENDLGEIDLRQGDTRIQLRRGREPVISGMGFPAMPPVAMPASNQPTPTAPADAPADTSHLKAITSPMVGTFYAAPDPDSPPFVKAGDQIGPETTVCIVEAMKILNHIAAEVSGKIVSVLVENGEPVEFGQKMFEVDTRA